MEHEINPFYRLAEAEWQRFLDLGESPYVPTDEDIEQANDGSDW
jgi:hypothetical protein